VFPFRRDPRTGKCKIFLGERSGRDDDRLPNGDGNGGRPPVFADGDAGEAINGRYGLAMVPGNMVIDRALCRRGQTLGNDGLCYEKSTLNNKQRMWPAGRKPLLTGGDMRAISIANRAGTRMDAATKRLQKMGMMKKPAAPRKAPARKGMVVKEAGAGGVTIQ
jgi:hypothetical protein